MKITISKKIQLLFCVIWGAVSVAAIVILAYEYTAQNKQMHRLVGQQDHSSLKNLRVSAEQSHEKTLHLIHAKILDHLPEHQRDSEHITRATMAFVYNNSEHLIDGEHDEYANNMLIVHERLYQASLGDKKSKPHLSCGPRAFSMRDILQTFNIHSRLIQVYTDDYDEISGHRLLEVYNSETRKWEVWDPDFGVVYVNRKDQTPVDILSLVFGNKNMFIPRGLTSTGWDSTGTRHLKEHFFKAVAFEEHPGTYEIIINSDLLDLKKTFKSGLTFEEWAIAQYQYPRIIILPGTITSTRL